MMLRDYSGKVAVITGAAGGLGRALALGLAARRCNLALIDIDPPQLINTAAEASACNIVVTHHCADVGSEEALQRVADQVSRAHGRPDLLINNAGVSGSSAFANMTAAAFEQIMEGQFLRSGEWLSGVFAGAASPAGSADSERGKLLRVDGLSPQDCVCLI
jgi:NAD(P)-dependent dehydrogenase (short-subunit alcohol dehydrogenase family)